MGRKQIGVLVVFLLLLASAVYYFLGTQQPEVLQLRQQDYEVQWAGARLIGRFEGKRQWEMELDTMTKQEHLVFLHDIVEVVIFHRDRPYYSVQADQGVWDRESDELTLTGNILITGQDGSQMSTEQVIWHGESEELEAPQRVAMSFGSTQVEADRMLSKSREDLVYLTGNVSILEGDQAWELENLIYNFTDESMEILGNARIIFGPNRQKGELGDETI